MKKRPEKEDYLINGHDLSNVINEMELQVIAAMKELLPKNDKFDGCQICLEDIYALSLNRLDARYVQVGTIVLHKDTSPEEIHDIVAMTISQIVNRPNHD